MPKKSLLKNKTLIIGCGRLGSSIANQATKEGKNVLCIDRDKHAFERLDDTFSGYTFVGDVTDLDLLESAFIQSTKEIIITTGDDTTNIFLAYVARDIYNVPNIYVRLDDPTLEVLLEGKDAKAILPFQLTFDKYNLIREDKKRWKS